MATFKGIPLSKISPAFLHANSTSHTWAFSAFAELIDNAYDPDVSASELLIDKIDISGIPCLIFLDNGAGMDSEHLLKMLSFGYCEKQVYERSSSHMPIGHYGNGFKSGSMRLAKDALVFTRCHSSASIGFLSQNYLKAINADSVFVPILTYRLPKLERIKSQESRNNLDAILKYSVFHSERDLKEELLTLEGSVTGTKIILSNLKRLQDSRLELDFSSDETDIRCPEAHEVDLTSVYHRPIQQSSSEYKHSLREYCSILFLRPRMKITIRGMRVKSKLISKSLSQTELDSYKPTWLNRPLRITFGFTCDKTKTEDYGIMMYHRNRLIKAFEKVGYQKQPNDLGVGVVGVAQVDFLQPTHNKQDFNKDEKFNSVMAAFATKLNDYWNEKKHNYSQGPAPVMARSSPDWLWAQCEQCLKWRRLPDGVRKEDLADQWFCRLNADPTHNRCEIPEEPEDEDLAIKPSYEKTFKRKQEERKRQQQIDRQREEDLKRQRMFAREKELKQKEAELMALKRSRNMNQPPPQMSSAQSGPNHGALTNLQRALAEAQKREERQKRMLLQIEEEKKKLSERHKSILQLAETLKTGKGENSEDVLKKMSNLLGVPRNDATTPSPQKRKIDDNSSNSRGGKRPLIKEEIVDNTPPTRAGNQPPPANTASANHNSGSLPSKSAAPIQVKKPPGGAESSSKPSPQTNGLGTSAGTMDVIDLTEDGDDVKPNVEELRARQERAQRNGEEEEDVKPDKDDLDADMQSKENNKEKANNLPREKEPPEKRDKDKEMEGEKSLTEEEMAKEPEEGDAVRFGPSEDDPEFKMGPTDTFHANLEVAMAVIMKKMSEETDDNMEVEDGSGDAEGSSSPKVGPGEAGEKMISGKQEARVKALRDGGEDQQEEEGSNQPSSGAAAGRNVDESFNSESDMDDGGDDDADDYYEDDGETEERSHGHEKETSRDKDKGMKIETIVAQVVEELVTNAMQIAKNLSFDDEDSEDEDVGFDEGGDSPSGRQVNSDAEEESSGDIEGRPEPSDKGSESDKGDAGQCGLSDPVANGDEKVHEIAKESTVSRDTSVEDQCAVSKETDKTPPFETSVVSDSHVDCQVSSPVVSPGLKNRDTYGDSDQMDDGLDDAVSDGDDNKDDDHDDHNKDDDNNDHIHEPANSLKPGVVLKESSSSHTTTPPKSPCPRSLDADGNSSTSERDSPTECSRTVEDECATKTPVLNSMDEKTLGEGSPDNNSKTLSPSPHTSCNQFTQTEKESPSGSCWQKCSNCEQKCVLHKDSQTDVSSYVEDREKSALQEIIDNLRSKHDVKRQLLEQAETRVTSLCQDLHKLLGFILPDVSLGSVNSANDTEQMIKNMIKSHEESSMNTEEGSEEQKEESQSQLM